MTDWKKAVPYVLPYVLFVLVGALSPPLGDYVPLSYPFKVVLIAALLFWWRKSYGDLSITFSLFPVFAGAVVFLGWIGLTEYSPIAYFHPPAEGYNPFESGSAALAVFLAVSRIGGAALVVPFFEELFIRSFVLRYLVDPVDFRKVPPGTYTLFSFVGSTVLFTLGHHTWEWPAAIFASVVYTILLYRRGHLADCILAHGVTNLLLGIYVFNTGKWGYW